MYIPSLRVDKLRISLILAYTSVLVLSITDTPPNFSVLVKFISPVTSSLYDGVVVPIPTLPLIRTAPETPNPPNPAVTELYEVSYPMLNPLECLTSPGASKSVIVHSATYQSNAVLDPPDMA